jgi:hypothetical protein
MLQQMSKKGKSLNRKGRPLMQIDVNSSAALKEFQDLENQIGPALVQVTAKKKKYLKQTQF